MRMYLAIRAATQDGRMASAFVVEAGSKVEALEIAAPSFEDEENTLVLDFSEVGDLPEEINEIVSGTNYGREIII